jgi:hypothetical protein
MRVGVVAAIGEQAVEPSSRPADLAGHGRDRVDEGQKLGYVVAIGGGDTGRERKPRLVDDQVVLGAQPAAVDRARARLGAPFFACTWEESTAALCRSIWLAWRSRSSRTWCNSP